MLVIDTVTYLIRYRIYGSSVNATGCIGNAPSDPYTP
jgi:hypothetical protein